MVKSFLTALKYVFRRSATIKYPHEVRVIPERTRGRHILVSDKCTGCSMCAMVCPAKAITMKEAPEGMPLPKTNARKRIPYIDYSKCILCGMCVDVCNFDALYMSKDIYISGKSLGEVRLTPQEYAVVSEKLEEYRKEVDKRIAPKTKDIYW